MVVTLMGAEGSPCSGYTCLKDYVDMEDGAYSWVDTGHRLVVDPSRYICFKNVPSLNQ